MNAHHFEVETVDRINTLYFAIGVTVLFVMIFACTPLFLAFIQQKSMKLGLPLGGVLAVASIIPSMFIGIASANAYGNAMVDHSDMSFMTEQVVEDSEPSLWNQDTRDEIYDVYGYSWQTVRKEGKDTTFIFKDPDGALVPCELNLMQLDPEKVAYKAVFTCQEAVPKIRHDAKE